jgi:hypothetical protein
MYFGPVLRMHSDTCSAAHNEMFLRCLLYFVNMIHGMRGILLWLEIRIRSRRALFGFCHILKGTIRLSFRALFPWICEQSMWPRIGNTLCDCPLRRTVDAVMLSSSTLAVWYHATLVEQFGNEKYIYVSNSCVTVCCQSERKVGNMLANTLGPAHSVSPGSEKEPKEVSLPHAHNGLLSSSKFTNAKLNLYFIYISPF